MSLPYHDFFGSIAAFADTVSGTGTAAFQSWTAANLNQNGAPYWDNTSLDGSNKNIGFFLVNAPTAPLAGAPGALPYWGNAFNSVSDIGGLPDLNFTFLKNSASSIASLQLEVAANSNLNEFGWYSVGTTNLHPIFSGPTSAPATDAFNPTGQYGFYLKGSNGTFFSQSSLNPSGDTSHQHFIVFEQSSTNGAEIYWLGIEDLSVHDLFGAEGGAGDYNDMIIRISAVPVPEPSTVILVLCGSLLVLGLRKRSW